MPRANVLYFLDLNVSKLGKLGRVTLALSAFAISNKKSRATKIALRAYAFVELCEVALDICLLGPLLGGPLKGREIREAAFEYRSALGPVMRQMPM